MSARFVFAFIVVLVLCSPFAAIAGGRCSMSGAPTFSDSTATGEYDCANNLILRSDSSGVPHGALDQTCGYDTSLGNKKWTVAQQPDITSNQFGFPADASSDHATSAGNFEITSCDGSPDLVGTHVFTWLVFSSAPADCSATAGKAFDWNDDTGPFTAGSWAQSDSNHYSASLFGRAVCVKPDVSSPGGCPGHVTSSACQVTQRSDGVYDTCSGIAIYDTSGSTCVEGSFSPAGSAKNVRGTTVDASGDPLANGSLTGVSGGGDGTLGGAGADSLNLARIATNTYRIAQGMTSVSAGGDGTSSGGSGSCGGSGQPACVTSGSCGGDGQPACAVRVDEGGVAVVATSSATDRASQLQAMNGTMDGNKALLPEYVGEPEDQTGYGGQYVPPGGRWMPSISQFLPAPICEADFEFNFPLLHMTSYHFSICAWQPVAQSFLGIFMAGITLFSLFNNIFKPGN